MSDGAPGAKQKAPLFRAELGRPRLGLTRGVLRDLELSLADLGAEGLPRLVLLGHALALIRAARMLKRRLANILTYLQLPLTNARSESVNAKIQMAQVQRSWLSQSGEPSNRHLLSLRWSRPQPTLIPEEP